jgi:hypothetical protein
MTCEEKMMPGMKRGLLSRLAPSLERFVLEELALFRKEGTFASNASRDAQLLYGGGDDVHGIFKYLLSRATTSLSPAWHGCCDCPGRDAQLDDTPSPVLPRRTRLVLTQPQTVATVQHLHLECTLPKAAPSNEQ